MQEPTTLVGGRAAPISDALVDELLAGRELTAEAITGPRGLLQELTGRLVERALGAELVEHLGYGPGDPAPADQPNRRNGAGRDSCPDDADPHVPTARFSLGA